MEASFVTVLFTDIVGSTALYDRLGDDEADRRCTEHFAALRRAVAAHSGREVKTVGDGLMVAFSSAAAAVRCAVDMQLGTTGAEDGLPLRVGIDAGEPITEDEDLYGTAVIVASRLCNAAEAGEILTTEVVRQIAGPRVGAPMDSLGAKSLKGVAEPVAIARVQWRADEQEPAGVEPESGVGRVPAPLTSLIGRARELEGVAEALRHSRLVTLAGPGGVGKTRLSIELARRRRRDPVWFIDLSAASPDGDPATEVARTLEVGGGSGAAATEALRRYLASRSDLLVLDNCEHMIDACARFADALLATCRDIRILATSREPLGIAGETVWRLDPLGADEAARLFVERARQRRPQFVPEADADATIAELCARLDRLPLAIELAAARIGVMSPAEILSGLDEHLAVLGSGSRLSPERHRTVRGAVEWSYRLLDPVEQIALRNLAVFVGGFDAKGATAVAPGLTLDVLARLIDKSLVAVSEQRPGRTRYRLLELVREYGLEVLTEAGEVEAARELHLAYFVATGDVEREGWPASDADALIDELEPDYENIRAALEWGAESDPCSAMRLLGATLDLFLQLGQADYRRLAEMLLARCPARDRDRARVQIPAGLSEMLVGDANAARAALTEARALCADLGEPGLEGYAWLFHGLTETLDVNVEAARPLLEQARTLFRESGRRTGEARANSMLGLAHVLAGEFDEAQTLLDQAITMQHEEGFRWGEGQAHVYAGILAEDSGATRQRITAHYRAAVELLRPYRDVTLLPAALFGQASVLAATDAKRALRVAAAASAIRLRSGGDFQQMYQSRANALRDRCVSAIGSGADAIWAEGTRLTVDEAIALAFGTSSPRRPDAAPAGLSGREVEVVRLVADGMSNKAIAAALHLSVRTVESHVRNVLGKAGLDNRTQLATWARDRL